MGQIMFFFLPTSVICWKPLQIIWTQIRPGLEVIKLFSCSTQLSTKFILLISVKMPTIVGILTYISMINTTYERLKAINFFVCWYFSFYEQLKFVLSWVEREKSFLTSRPDLDPNSLTFWWYSLKNFSKKNDLKKICRWLSIYLFFNYIIISDHFARDC